MINIKLRFVFVPFLFSVPLTSGCQLKSSVVKNEVGSLSGTNENSKYSLHESAVGQLVVTTVSPKEQGFDETIEVLGVVTPKKLSTVHSLLEGKVLSCGKKSGDFVRIGEVICSLDESLVNIEYLRAQNALESTQRALDPIFFAKQKALFEAGVIGQLEFEKLRIEVERASALQRDAQNSVALVEKKRELHKIVAPFEGRIVEVKVQAGQPISPAIPAAVLATTNGVFLRSEVPAKYFSVVKPGTRLKVISIASDPVEVNCAFCESIVTSKSEVVQLERQTFFADAPISMEGIAPGMLMRSMVTLKSHKPSVVIPFSSLLQWESATKTGKIFVLDESSKRVFTKEITTTDPISNLVHVRKGLAPNDRVVHPVPSGLSNGAQVQFKEVTSP